MILFQELLYEYPYLYCIIFPHHLHTHLFMYIHILLYNILYSLVQLITFYLLTWSSSVLIHEQYFHIHTVVLLYMTLKLSETSITIHILITKLTVRGSLLWRDLSESGRIKRIVHVRIYCKICDSDSDVNMRTNEYSYSNDS